MRTAATCIGLSLATLLCPLFVYAQMLRVDVSRDTWISEVDRGGNGSNGGATRLKVKGIQEFSIVDIDPGPLRGRVIQRATLHLRPASADLLKRITISSLSSDWSEGTASNYATQQGSASFNWARQDLQPWAWPGSDLTAVCNGGGNSIWRFADASPPDAQGWQTIEVDPSVLHARIAGISWGFVVFDDVGSEYTRDGDKFTYHHMPNRFLYSREEGKNRAPYFTVQLGPEDHQPPQAIDQIQVTTDALPAGEAILSWTTPADQGSAGVIGFEARCSTAEPFDWKTATPIPQYLVPLAGQQAQMHLHDLGFLPGQHITVGLRPVDAAGNAGPITTSSIALSSTPATIPLPETSIQPFSPAQGNLSLAGMTVSVIDPLDKIHPLTGQLIPHHDPAYLQANHLFSSVQKRVRLFGARKESVAFQLILSGPAKDLELKAEFDDPAITADFTRLRHVRSKLGLLPDPLVPLDTPEELPTQKFASFFVDLYIPPTAKPGHHTGTVTLSAANQSISLSVDLTVWNFSLPDHLSFIPEMNSYGLPSNDLPWYRLAQVNRAVLNRLAYNWRGGVAEDATPRWNGTDFDWKNFDHHYAPILDGSAFKDLPRGPIPVETFYLPLNENWPISIESGFKGGYWADTALTPAYRERFVQASRLWADHIADKGWKQTLFEFYLNNKVYYKDKSWSRCSAPWIFDEPVNTQDFWALRWYGQAFHQGVSAHNDVHLAFRCDISRPQWRRDILDGLLDVDVVGGDFRRYHRQVLSQKTRNGELLINYGSANPIEESNVQGAAWCLDTWCLGADGVLPWQTIGSSKSWETADELSLFYPPALPGLKDPSPSIRLKSYRRGEQDVEYLTILQAATHAQRFQVANTARQALGLAAQILKKSDADAGLVSYKSVDPQRLWALRVRIGEHLDHLAPPDRNSYTQLTPPARDTSRLPAIGYIGK